ncbi:hypothetical protein D9757_004221 [Collybiopsis confluens]|uniref:MADS-box domain-containing protein n=1 Tax=Collybiopsis confluens TaxID=2823264 RepID=A0A8H5MDC9_9AGAR|nr:hypothetical protein D9757_004221 [Collybiopsis confluens]
MSAIRKYGLFKKAYELGVLCSVDVAVIIFEEKPGHHAKLYQYCSSDVHDIVQRHLRHDGEKESRGPADFSGLGVPGTKFENFGDVDEEEMEEEEDLRRGVKRRNDALIKPEEMPLNLGYSDAPPVPVPGMNSPAISSDRHHLHHPLSPNKRSKYSGGGAALWFSSTGANNVGLSVTVSLSNDRNQRDSYNISPTNQGYSRSHHGQSTYNNNYLGGPLLRRRSNQSPPRFLQPRLIQRGKALATVTAERPTIPANMSSGGNSTGSEDFKYLEGESRNRAPGTTAHLGNNISWSEGGSSGYSPNTPISSSTQNTTPANDSTWLDFLSNSPTHGSPSVSNVHGATGRRHSDSVPWERGASTSRSSIIGSPYTRSMASIGDGSRRSRLNSVSGESNPSVSGGNTIPSGLGISVKQENDVGG